MNVEWHLSQKGPAMIRDADSTLRAGREASTRHVWHEAFGFLSAADSSSPLSSEDLERLAEAAWWTGRLSASISARERAYAMNVETGNSCQAGRVAIEVARNYFQKGDAEVGTAWLNRAERFLQGEPECIERGYLTRTRGVMAFEGLRDFDTALIHIRQALEIGTRFGDRDLMAIALHDQGRILVSKGQVAEGMAFMDEATVAAVAGELGPMATAIIYCNTITACTELADYPRARKWTEAAKRWCERQAIAGFPGMCRVYRAGIMRVGGAWPEAEQEAQRACEELREFNLSYCAAALYELGEVRLRMGDLAEAEDAFRQAHGLGRDPEPGLALLRLTEGRVKTALAAINRALADESPDRLHRARLLPAKVEIALAAGERDEAHVAAEELEKIAQAYGTPWLGASAACARGGVQLAQGDAVGAERSLHRAMHLWQEVDSPHEAAKARLLLASAYRTEGDEEAAQLELQAARAAFERLGARLDVQHAEEMLGSEAGAATSHIAPARRVDKTFMFTDIAQSTNLVQVLGDEAWAALVQWHDQTLRALFARYGGEEIDHAGDGFFVAFKEPASAIECAVTIQRTLAEHRRSHGFAPQVRIGLHTAPATRSGSGYRGKGVHEAARIATLAAGEQILASQVTAAGASFVASEPRTVHLKGLSEPVQVVAIEWR
jgi:class 3 adenylate cyclase